MEHTLDNLVTVSFEIDKELYNEASKICVRLGTTLEEISVEFLRFCANLNNLSKVKEILGMDQKEKEKLHDSKSTSLIT